MNLSSRIFVFIVFAILGVSFWATTGILYWEFSDNWRQPAFEGTLWFDLLTHYSHVFLFFPLFGTVALFAFFFDTGLLFCLELGWRR